MQHRFSCLDREAACPASFAQSIDKPNISGEAAAFGTAVHAIFASMAAGVPLSRELATRATAEEGIGERAEEAFELVRDCGFLPRGKPEVSLSLKVGNSVEILGTADLVIPDLKMVIDYKVTQLRRDAPTVDERLQVPGYAVAAAKAYGWTEVKAAVFNPILGQKGWSYSTYDADAMRRIEESIYRVASRADAQAEKPPEKREYRPGSACTFCPGKTTCPAIRASLIALQALVPQRSGDAIALPREKLPACYAQAKHWIKELEAACATIREDVLSGGDIEGDGGENIVRRSRWMSYRASKDRIYSWLKQHGHETLVTEMESEWALQPKIEEQYVIVTKRKEISDGP